MASLHTPTLVRKMSRWYCIGVVYSWAMLSCCRAHTSYAAWQALSCHVIGHVWCVAWQSLCYSVAMGMCVAWHNKFYAVSISQPLRAGDDFFRYCHPLVSRGDDCEVASACIFRGHHCRICRAMTRIKPLILNTNQVSLFLSLCPTSQVSLTSWSSFQDVPVSVAGIDSGKLEK